MHEWDKAASTGVTATAATTPVSITAAASDEHDGYAQGRSSKHTAGSTAQRQRQLSEAPDRGSAPPRGAEGQQQQPPTVKQQRQQQQPDEVGVRGGRRTSNGGGGPGSHGDPPSRALVGRGLVGDGASALAAAVAMAKAAKETTRAETASPAAQAGEARESTPAVPAPVTPAAGVVIRVLISGAHASFLHMRVFPSTTAGQVCRKIGEKMRLSPAEQDEYVLIAIYARPSAGGVMTSSSSYDSAADDSGGGGDLEGGAAGALAASNGGGSAADLKRGNSAEGGIGESRERRRESMSNSRIGRRDDDDYPASVKHILHTFRPEERLGELRLGLEEPPSPSPPSPAPQQQDNGKGTDGSRDSDAAGGGGRGGGSGADRRYEERGGQRESSGRRGVEEQERTNGVDEGSGRHSADRRRVASLGEGGGGDGRNEAALRQARHSHSQSYSQHQASMWRSRWIYRDRRSPAMEPDELQVEVSGSDTSEDEARADWVDLRGLGQGHYCGYLQKKSRRDSSLWRRRWCILADDRLWLLRSKSEQSGRRRGGGRSHSFSLYLVPCVARAVSRPTVPSHCFELHAQSRVHTFRAESRAKQVAWVGTLQRHARQAAEDSYMSVAEHMVCDEEYARCRRLNVTLSAALGEQACSSLEADYALSPSSRHQHPHGRPDKLPAGGSIGGGWVPLPPPALLPRTSGLFRRLPIPPPSSRRTSTAPAAATSVASDVPHGDMPHGDNGNGKGEVNTSRSPSPPLHANVPPPLPAPPAPPVLVSETAAAGDAAHGEGCWPRGTEVKRTLRFCMKVHRFREICRAGSCVSFRKRWAYAADALEELCPGAATATSIADLSRHWHPSPSPFASHPSAGLVGVNGGNGGENHDPPTAVATAASGGNDVTVAVSAGQQQTAAVIAGDGADDAGEANLDGVRASAKTLCAPSCSVPAALGSSLSLSLSTLPQPTPAAITATNTPVVEAVALPSAALASSTAPQPGQVCPPQLEQERPRAQDHLSLPAAACNEETLVAVARELQEYADAVARARSSREAKGGGKGGGGGRDVAGGALGAGALGAVSPSLYLQEPPPEDLFDALLDEVLLALGDA